MAPTLFQTGGYDPSTFLTVLFIVAARLTQWDVLLMYNMMKNSAPCNRFI